MEKIIFILLLSLLPRLVFGQVNLQNFSTSYAGGDTETGPCFLIAYPNDALYLDFSEEKTKSNGLFDFKQHVENTIFHNCDSSEAYFFVNNIFRSNAAQYEFRILENQDRELVAWQPIQQFAADSLEFVGYKKGMAYLGNYKTNWDKSIIAEIRQKGSSKVLKRVLVHWQQTKPEILNIYTENDLNPFLLRQKVLRNMQITEDEINKWKSLYPPNQLDTTNFLPKKLELEPKENNVIFYLKTCVLSSTDIEYQVLRDGEVYRKWQYNDFDNDFIWLKNLEHGNYKLQIRYAIQRHNVTDYYFRIKPEWYQSGRFQLILGVLTVFLPVLFILLFLFMRQKRKLKTEQKRREQVGNELKSIRSQLNPHFVFNALSSIQGLINKNDVAGANHYLTEFSGLMRETLMSSDKELVPLSMELKTLEAYIKLEQLRFPFQYNIEIAADLDAHAIEIPYLILQPLVENAIKHGVSSLYEKGEIGLRFYGKNGHLVAEISDNGKGFDPNTEGSGYGLKLTKERVRLLNDSNKHQPVNFHVEREGATTKVYLLFRNWL